MISELETESGDVVVELAWLELLVLRICVPLLGPRLATAGNIRS